MQGLQKQCVVDFTKSITRRFQLKLQSAIILEERRVLMDLSVCKSVSDDQLLQELFQAKTDTTENIKYLHSAINGLFDAWRSKRLQDTNDEGNHDGMDHLSLEEKPTDKHTASDFEKGQKIQQLMLQLWWKWLGSKRLVAELEAITCQFEERKITVFATRNVSICTDIPFISYHANSTDSIDPSPDNNTSDGEESEPEYVEEALVKAEAVWHPGDIVSVGDWEKNSY
ncbi:hypothetical protein BDA99DRAFT_558678 [Phascolomyces articulosus]|uniref:Uncharacterized protein n=1 Tax=Phascolomyces articulosus TaxID=60185 RepID=A0AAD5KH41_9FUNG|nr:hypothetical protein BDA99DRAFT_558678 [Phascolomyces articulosus]